MSGALLLGSFAGTQSLPDCIQLSHLCLVIGVAWSPNCWGFAMIVLEIFRLKHLCCFEDQSKQGEAVVALKVQAQRTIFNLGQGGYSASLGSMSLSKEGLQARKILCTESVHWRAMVLLLKKPTSWQHLYSRWGRSKSWANLYQMDDREERNESDHGKGHLVHIKSSWHTPPASVQLPCLCIASLAHAQERVKTRGGIWKTKITFRNMLHLSGVRTSGLLNVCRVMSLTRIE